MIDNQPFKTYWFSPLFLVAYLAIPLVFWGAISAGLIRLVSSALSGD